MHQVLTQRRGVRDLAAVAGAAAGASGGHVLEPLQRAGRPVRQPADD